MHRKWDAVLQGEALYVEKKHSHVERTKQDLHIHRVALTCQMHNIKDS